ncbi:hypothetical protein BG005_007613 [Podila minutissima]|nr:hypothetical protein BG005_007613 [Podila minutissima]
MVRLPLSFLATALTAFASAASINTQHASKNIGDHKCLPDTDIFAGVPFLVENRALASFVSMLNGDGALHGGIRDDPNLTVLQFVIHPYRGMGYPGECVKGDVEYIFEVRADHHGAFLQVRNGLFFMVLKYDELTPLFFHPEKGVRISQNTPEGPRHLDAVEPGWSLVFWRPESKNERQMFDLLPLPSNKTVEACDDKQEHSLW